MHVAEKKEVGRSITAAVCAAVAVFGLSCGPSEEEILITELTEDLNSATTIIDSLNYTVESSNMLIDEMKSRVDSLHRVTPKLLESVQRLNKEVKKWANLASEHKRKNQQLTVEMTAAIERAIRRHPSQWPWMHQRWHSTPEIVLRRRNRRARRSVEAEVQEA